MSQWNCHPGECLVECGGGGGGVDLESAVIGFLELTFVSLVSVEGGTHVVGYEDRSHTLVPSVACSLSAASVA
jgi:hypothetical protein